MEILRKGTLPTRQFRCKNCGCEFVAEPSEFSEELHAVSQNGTQKAPYSFQWMYETKCPWCGHKVVVLENKQ